MPRADDFTPDPQYIRSTTSASLAYWESFIKEKCDTSNRISPDFGESVRDVFAFGSVIVKSSHLYREAPPRDFSLIDANEIAALEIAREAFAGTTVKVPEVLFLGKIQERDAIVQTRIPGVGLNVSWQYLSKAQKQSFKAQCRELLRKLDKIFPPEGSPVPSYLVPDSNPMQNRNIDQVEYDILFDAGAAPNKTERFGLMHNDFNVSNIIVDNDRIVGIVDWEMAGYFGWRRAAAVHCRCRTSSFSEATNLSEEEIADLTFWEDLYDDASS